MRARWRLSRAFGPWLRGLSRVVLRDRVGSGGVGGAVVIALAVAFCIFSLAFFALPRHRYSLLHSRIID
jgi:hypothetical protein